jgi:hypothetical protein
MWAFTRKADQLSVASLSASCFYGYLGIKCEYKQLSKRMYGIKNKNISDKQMPRKGKLLSLTWFFLIVLLIINLMLVFYSFGSKNKEVCSNSALPQEGGDLQTKILELEANNREIYGNMDKMSVHINTLESEKKALKEQCDKDSE